MEVAGVPHGLIAWTAQRGSQTETCHAELEHEYVTATGDEGNPKFGPVVTGRTRDALNRVAAKKTCPSMPRARSLARLRADGKTSATLAVGVDVLTSLLERARAAARTIRARVAAVADIDLAAVDVAAIAWVMHRDGFFHRRHLLAEARRHLALVLRGRLREPGLDERIADAALAAHRTDITEPRTQHGKNQEHRLCTTRWAPGPPPARRRPSTGPDPDHKPAPDPAASHLPLDEGEWPVPRDPLRYDRAVIASTVLSARLRTARRASRDPYPYDGFAHRQAALPEQLFLFVSRRRSPYGRRPGPSTSPRCAPGGRWRTTLTACALAGRAECAPVGIPPEPRRGSVTASGAH
jgi:hypothetical protein